MILEDRGVEIFDDRQDAQADPDLQVGGVRLDLELAGSTSVVIAAACRSVHESEVLGTAAGSGQIR